MRNILKMKNFILVIFIVSCVSCKKDLVQPIAELNGIYTGIFTVEYSEDPIFYDENILSNDVTIVFEDSIYSCSNGENYIPAGGSGKYELIGKKISFNDENGWFGNFDENLILNGVYEIQNNNSTIVISAHNGIGYYEYKLIKQ